MVPRLPVAGCRKRGALDATRWSYRSGNLDDMRCIEVVVEGGGDNLYEVLEVAGRFMAYKVSVNLFLPNTRGSIGAARSLEGALSLIRSHSGKGIKSIDA